MNKLQELELEDLAELGIEVLGEEKVKNYFRINNLDKANWAFRKLKAIDEKIAEVTALADAEIKRINEWKDNEIKDFDRSINFFNFLLGQYYREQRELDPKFKLSTPYGRVSSRKQQDKWTYEDEKVIESLKAREINHLIKTKEISEVDKVELKKSVEILNDVVSLDGVIVKGIEFNKEIKAFIDTETGEIDSYVSDCVSDYEYHKQAIVYNGQVIEGITVQEQPDSISIKVVEV